ncbi:MAG: PorT family protein [Bacteroidota bacterium]|nr:PorT family protein [Bacteroidota bacterium]
MKKLFLSMVIICAFAISSFAQKTPFFSVGPKIGTNHSNFLSKNHEFGKDGILGYQAGAFLRLGFMKSYIQPEAYYNFKSTSLVIEDQNPGGTTDFSGQLKFNNIDVPILLGTKIFDAKVFNLRVFAGPMVSFLLRDENSSKNYNPDNYDFNNKIWGGQAGLGMDIGNVTLDFRYQSKMTNISSLLSGPASSIHLSAGIKLF